MPYPYVSIPLVLILISNFFKKILVFKYKILQIFYLYELYSKLF